MSNPIFKTPALLFALVVALHANGATPTTNTASASQVATVGDGGQGGSIRKSAQAIDISGEWLAEIDCGKGPFDARVSFGPLAGGPQMVGALVLLKPRPSSKMSPGSYSMRGELRAGELRLREGSWLQKSQDIPMLSIDATVYSSPDRIAGRALEAGCSRIDLRRLRSLFAETMPPRPAVTDPAKLESVKPLTYRAITKIIGDADGNERLIAARLVGRPAILTLKATGPQALVVNPKDGVFFVCTSRSPAFRHGAVAAKIAAYETTPDGDVSISLDRCGNSLRRTGRTPIVSAVPDSRGATK